MIDANGAVTTSSLAVAASTADRIMGRRPVNIRRMGVKIGLFALSIAAFSWGDHLQTALVFVAAIALHEQGHVWAARLCGVESNGFYMIPFMGGVAISDMPASSRQRLIILFGGPLMGLLTTPLIAGCVWLATHDLQSVGEAAAIVGLLNLGNLAPVPPLDGGQIVMSLLSPSRRWVKTTIMVACLGLGSVGAWYLHSVTAEIMLVLGTAMVVSQARSGDGMSPLAMRQALWWGLAYLALVLLAVGVTGGWMCLDIWAQHHALVLQP